MNNSIKVRNQYKCLVLSLALVIALAAPTVSRAVTDTMTANDTTAPNSSFNTSVHWASGLAPGAGTNYSTLGYLMRSPVSGGQYQAGTFTFAGDSLTVGGGNGGGSNPFLTNGGVNNNSLIFKQNALYLTVNNLILDAGTVRDGLNDNQFWALNGNMTVTANGGGFAAQSLGSINSVISGSGPLYFGDQGNAGDTGRGIFLTSGSSTYNGNMFLVAGSANHVRLTFTSGSVMNFTIGGIGVNNSISVANQYAEFAGAFNINVAGADNTVGDSWTLVSTGGSGSNLYDGTFSVNGFTQNGTLWDDLANGVDYEYSQTTGALTVLVPEPSTFALIGLGLGCGGLLLRRKHSRS